MKTENHDFIYNKSLTEIHPEPVIVINSDYQITDMNSKFVSITNKKREDILGTYCYDYFKDSEKVKKNCAKLFEIGFFHDEELELLGHNEKDILYNGFIYKNEKKENLESVIIGRNISVQKKYDTKFQDFLESLPDAIIIVNNDGNIRSVNIQAETLFGYNRTEIIGKQIAFLMPSRFKESHNHHMQYYFANPKVRKMGEGMQLFAKHKNQTEFPVEISLSKLDIEEKFLVCASIRDVSHQKRIEEELTDAIIKAENGAKSKQQFLANMSHEIRTPMNSIIGFTKVMLKTELTPKQKEYINAIKMSGDTLIVLINDILDLAKVDSGKMVFNKAPFKLALSISTILHLFENKIREKNLELVVKYDQKIPEVLLGDAIRLHQIILNLVSNAVKFTFKGKIAIGIRKLTEDNENVTLEFSISDTGIGIEVDKMDQIFENFQQAHSQTSIIFGGTGLGLAIVKQLVEGQGGSIKVESELGKGSTFSFVLAFKKADKTTVLDSEIIEFVDNRIKDVKVLVVEDVELNQLLMKTILDDFGFECEIAENGDIAVEKLKKNSYDIILMDLQMPVMNGFQATDYIRNTLKSSIPIIALTADVTSVDIEKCKAVGMNDYIAKPIDDKTLYRKIEALIKKSTSRIEFKTLENHESKSQKCIDISYLKIITKSNHKLMTEMINVYLDQTPILINSIKKSWLEQDLDTLKSAVHKLIPSFTIVGIDKKYEIMARKIEDETITAESHKWILELENIFLQASEELKMELNNLKK
ncbi:PAS domain-containing hybrid sensor histidine kinase/response regulator [Flavobacterium luteum]|uniref:Sensory/regulatory protein RpfC n=1 Tax=Flavobacterium luteum TaxID=2026654 RepID=A0A7J5AJ44_9FLAO|nr:ATP-binding protein [Flavobacterium luteum]KAB1157594.1 response regulator [Flavobacterium luteum]